MKNEMLTRPIGTRFNCCGVVLEVVENTLGPDGFCGGENDHCYFDDGCDKDMFECRGCCSNYTRSDGKDVYFKEVES